MTIIKARVVIFNETINFIVHSPYKLLVSGIRIALDD